MTLADFALSVHAKASFVLALRDAHKAGIAFSFIGDAAKDMDIRAVLAMPD